MLNFRPGQRLEVELDGQPKSGYVKARKVLSLNELILSQSVLEKAKFPIYHNAVIRIFSEENTFTEVFQGVVGLPDEAKLTGIAVGDKETLYYIKNIFRKEKHSKRYVSRLKIKLPAEITWIPGPFSRRVWKAETSDISLKGLALVVNEQPPKTGSEITVTINLEEKKSAKLRGEVRAAREINPFGVAGSMSGHEYSVNVEIIRISDQDYINIAEFIKSRQ